MITHLLLPSVQIHSDYSHSFYNRYLNDWRENAIVDADNDVISASICLQAVLIDIILKGKIQHDWLSIMDDLLTVSDRPVAYSKGYGKLLYNFDEQYLQCTVHSIHTRWWIEKMINAKKIDHEKYAKLILSKKSADGLIYDSDVSETIFRHRMKSELTMSAAMSAEILLEAGYLTKSLCVELSTNLCDPRKIPPLCFITSEQFRLAALRILSHEEQFPLGIGDRIEACSVGLSHGWNDFSIVSKVDDYMGTSKRTAYDKPIHSPLISCHVIALLDKVDELVKQNLIYNRLINYAKMLSKEPLDIPSFKMRDIIFPFGADITPIEAICASWLINTYSKREMK